MLSLGVDEDLFLQPWRLRGLSRSVLESRLTEAESSSSEALPDLHSSNYRILSWDMPVDIPELIVSGKNSLKRSNEVARQPIRTPSLRDEDYFRSFFAIHFCHNPEFMRNYDVRGTRLRDERRRVILGDSYYCINHPPHYRMMEYRLRKEQNLQEDRKAKDRRVKTSCLSPRRKDRTDPVSKLPEPATLVRTDMSGSLSLRVSKHLTLRTTSSDVEPASMPFEQIPEVQSITKLYKQAKAILSNILPPPEESTNGILQRLYKSNELTAFETYNYMTDNSISDDIKDLDPNDRKNSRPKLN
ncbi:hypothetical protein FGIG_08466 [Fasciola gigantica]|uniref:Uncharacterized protein n=1 Tax=Fasciola gigantica TaxID=46835 RepID=A0A504Y8B3_FASGI|nr:hypothetical protein FGIG_08466 [Fasciola gigantica]